MQRAAKATAREAKIAKELGSSKNKICQSCGKVFVGRRSKTCSDRCRRRLQRAEELLAKETGKVKSSGKRAISVVEKDLHELEKDIASVVEPEFATEEGFVGDETATQQAAPETVPVRLVSPQPAQTVVNPAAANSLEPQPQPSQLDSSLEGQPQNLTAPAPAADASSGLGETFLTDAAQAQSEPDHYESPLRRLLSPKLVTYGVLSMLLVVGMATALFVYSRGQKTPVTSGSNLSSSLSGSTINTTGDSLHINFNTIVDRGKTLIATGPVTVQNTTNSAASFQIQNAAGTSNTFIADTINNRIGIGKVPTLGALDVNGAIYQNGHQVCDTSGNCVIASANGGGIGGSGSSGTIALFTGAGLTIGNSNLSQSGTTVTVVGNLNVTGQFQSGGNQISSANLSNDANLAKLNANQTFTGVNTFTGGVRLQNAGGTNLLSVNSQNNQVELGQANAQTGALTFYGSANGNSITVAGLNGPTSNQNIFLPDASGTICLTTGNCAGLGGNGNILQGGNSFGTALLLGTNDNFGFNLETNGHVVAGLSNTGAATFQNFSDSTNAFQIQNAAGTSNLFVADSTDSKIGIGTSTPTATLTIKDNFSNPPSTANLTVSGNEITDATRTTNTQGDGRTPPDSSYGIWEATTNLVTNGGFESNTTGWANNWAGNSGGASTIAQSSTQTKFGTHSLSVAVTGNSQGAYFALTPTNGTTYTYSAWAWIPTGLTVVITSTNATSSNYIGTNSWQRLTYTYTAGGTDTGVYIRTNATGSGTFYIDGVQAEQKPIATPYVETNGSTASRSAARVQAPVNLTNVTQGWFAARVRAGGNNSQISSVDPGLFVFQDDNNHYLTVEFNSNQWKMYRANGLGTSVSANSSAVTFSAGDLMTVIGAWDSTTLKISVNGSAFATAVQSNIPTLASSTFDIGSGGTFANGKWDGDILWAATGTGTLTNTDAANLNAFGNTDPTTSGLFSNLSSNAASTMVWAASTASYQLQTGIINPTALQVQDMNGTNLLTVNANSSVGSLLSLGTNTTTAAGGIAFGTDTYLYRSGTGALTLQGTGVNDTLQAAAAVGSDTAGSNLILAGGQGTGAGAGGNINLQIAKANPGATNQSFITGASSPGSVFTDSAHVYWSNVNNNTIGRANLDGSGVNQSFITATSPAGVVVDSGHIYWANRGAVNTIGRANLDGSGVNQSFITGANTPGGMAIDSSHIYWGNIGNNTIGRANLDGSGVNQSFITGTNGVSGVAVDGAHIYWGNFSSNTIGRANLDGSGVNQSFITGASQPNGTVADSAHIYWTNSNANTIGRANLDGSGVNQSFITGASAPAGMAVDGNFLYWANNSNGTIGRFSFNTANNALSTVASLSGVNGAALFQNAADSTTAFQIQNAAGTSNLFVANTTNASIGIGTTPPANATLTVKDMFSNTSSSSTVTVSGNEITDATRTTNTQGDGRTPPDSSFGIWEGTTNLVTNGGFETNLTGWSDFGSGVTRTRDATVSKFGSASQKVVAINSSDAGTISSTVSASAGNTYTASAWVNATAGQLLLLALRFSPSLTASNNQFNAAGGWQRVTVTGTAPAGTTAADLTLRLIGSTVPSATFWMDGMQIEQKATATPYVETNGSTASRSAARVQAPSSILSASQGWVAMRLRMGWAIGSGTTTRPGFFQWGNSTTWQNSAELGAYVFAPNGQIAFYTPGGNQTPGNASYNLSTSVGDYATLVFAWTPTQLEMSLNGQVFKTTTRTTVGAPSADATFDIGRQNDSGLQSYMDSDYLWFASGTGTLTDTDASTLNNYGNTDPGISTLSSALANGAPTMFWAANDTGYQTQSSFAQPLVFQVQNANATNLLSVDATNAKLTAGTSAIFQNASNSTTAFQVQNAAGTTLLGVDTTTGLVNLGTPGSSGANGQIVFNSTNAGGYGVTLEATSGLSSSYALKLPTVAPSQSQCLQVDSVDATQLTFGACTTGSGGSVDLQGAYNNSSSPATITTTSPSKTLIFKAGTSNDSTALFQIQNSSGTDLFRADTTDSRVMIGSAAGTPQSVLSVGTTTTASTFDLESNHTRLQFDTAENNGDFGLSQGDAQIINATGNLYLGATSAQTAVKIAASTGAVTLKNATDSTAAFQIQNAAGTSNLLVADTADTRIGIGTAAPTATLSVVGNGLIQASTVVNPTLTVSGNEITDTTRTTNIQGDGRTPPDSSYGIWEGTTNLVTNGGFESNTTGWTVDSTHYSDGRTNTLAKFGSYGFQQTAASQPGDNYTYMDVSGLVASTAYTVSAWVNSTSFTAENSMQRGLTAYDPLNAGTLVTARITGATSGWVRLSVTVTTTSAGGSHTVEVRLYGPQGTVYWDGVQLEQKAIATPYVETNDSTASRSDARVQAPISNMNATQGWFAARVRTGVASSTAQTGYIAAFGGDGNHKIVLFWDGSAEWALQRSNGSFPAVSIPASFSPGQTVTVVGSWTATQLAISVNGGAFTTLANSSIPSFSPTTMDIGSGGSLASSRWFDGDILWLSSGTGVLTDTDAANLNAFGNSDPSFGQLPSLGTPTLLWQANSSSYLSGSSPPLVFNVQNSTGSNLLSVDANTGAVILQGATSSTAALILGTDANLYRSSAATLKTDGSLAVGTNLAVTGTSTLTGNVGIGTSPGTSLLTVGTNTTTAAGGIAFGTDTNLYRSGTGALTIQGTGVNDTLQAAAASGTDTAGSNLILAGGQGTGVGNGGNINLQIAKPGIDTPNQSFISGANNPASVAVDSAHIYWTNSGANTIGRANLDGTGVNQSFITTNDLNGVRGIAVNGSFIYWANSDNNTISRANLDGTGVNNSFITGANGPIGVAVDTNFIYWTNASAGTIGRANLDGSSPNQSFITGANAPRGIAVDSSHVYWANNSNTTIGRANLDGTSANQSFITTGTNPDGVTVDSASVYWENRSAGTIGRANLDGSSPNQSFITGANSPSGVVVAAGYIYWTNNGSNTIGRMNLSSGLNTLLTVAAISGVNGAALFQNVADSTTGFQIQNAAGTSNLFVADTSNTRIGLGATPANSLLTVGTNTTTAAGGITFGTDTSLYRSATNSLKTNSNLTVTGSGLFQNSSDSTSSFQIQNAAGTSNLLVADTTDSRIGIGTATPTATLNVNGSGLIQQSTAAGNNLTVSGNEITDATRTANTQGDGRTPPDSSYGIWEGTTNLVTNGGFVTNTTGWSNAGVQSATLSRVTTQQEFGLASMSVVSPGALAFEGASTDISGASAGVSYTLSVWIKAPNGADLFITGEDRNSGGALTNHNQEFIATGSWQRVSVSWTSVTGTTAVRAMIYTGPTQAITFYVDGVQVEQKPIATPYVETNGSTASRNAARVQAPAGVLSATQGWFAARIRAGVAASTWQSIGHSDYVFEWRQPSGNQDGFEIRYRGLDGTWRAGKIFGGAQSDAISSTGNSFAIGDYLTLIAYWTSSTIQISVNGSSFVSVSLSGAPNLSSVPFDIGSDQLFGNGDGDMDFLWTASGTGTLTNTDATNINNFGNTDPNLTSFAGPTDPTMVWAANTATYRNSNSQPIVFQVQNSVATNLLSIDANAAQLTAGTSAIFQNSSNSTTAFQVQNAAGTTFLGVDTTSGLVNLGTPGASGANGQIVFNSATAGNYAVTLGVSSNQAASYTLKLPTATPTTSQCLQTNSIDATQLAFGSCGSGGNINQGGNSFGTALLLGSNDNFGFNLETNGHIVAGLSNTGAATFQNFSDSTSAFQIQNAAGTSNLFVADSTDSKIGIGTAAPTATLTVTDMFAAAPTNANLTVSGNEITDATRTTNTQGDGATVPDSSYGIWEGTTNLVKQGGFEGGVNSSYWAAARAGDPTTISTDSSTAKFGSYSVKVVASVAEPDSTNGSGLFGGGDSAGVSGAGAGDRVMPVTAGQTYTASGWVKSTAGKPMYFGMKFQDSSRAGVGGFNLVTTFTATGGWQYVFYTTTAPTGAVGAAIQTGFGSDTGTFWVDGVQLEQKPVATPYVETNGGTASRSDARVSAPSSVVTPTQGWIAVRIRAGYSSASPPTRSSTSSLFSFQDDSSNYLRMAIFHSDNTLRMWRGAGGSSTQSSQAVPAFSAGDYITVIGAWTGSVVKTSVNGAAFTQQANTNIPSLANSLFEIGMQAPSAPAEFADSDILWTATGTGTLTNTDAANLNAFGNTDPNFNQLPATGTPTMLWKANNSNYITSSNADIVLQANNNAGSSLLSLDATNSKLTVNTQGLFQNTTNSSNAFTVNTSTGTQLFNVNTANLQVSTNNLQSSGAVNLTNSQGTVSLAGSLQNSSQTLTTSGNEITDAERAIGASSTNTAGQSYDGKTSDSSYGIWEGTTNLVTNGGFESNTTGWTIVAGDETLVRTTTTSKFGSGSASVTTTANATRGLIIASASRPAVSASTAYTYSAWVNAPAGAPMTLRLREYIGATPQGDTDQTFIGTGTWQRVSVTRTMTSTGGSTASLWVFQTDATVRTFYVDGAQLEQKAIATPYVETNGVTASRSAARIQAPASNLNATQGWAAVRVRFGWASTTSLGFLRFLSWGNDGNNALEITNQLNPGGGIAVVRRTAGSGANANASLTWNAGDTATIVATWTASTLNVSVNGGAFITVANNTIPSITSTTFDIGDRFDSTSQADSDILWAATGTGTLSNSDATTLNNLGNTDPTLAKLYSLNGGAGQPTFVWNANTANYQDITSSNGQALIYAANTSGATTGNLIDLQSGLYPSSKFSVDVNGNLTDVGTALFQNTTDSTAAFQIQNAAGTSNLFVADTTDSRIGIGTATPTATLSVNGTGLIQASSASNPQLTVSGNEITDATRTTNTQGDGRTPPDSSEGIWEGTTNLITNGGFENNTTGWGAWSASTAARTTSRAKFGSASLALSGSTNPYIGGSTGFAPTTGTQYTASLWFKPVETATYSLRASDATTLWNAYGPQIQAQAGVWTRYTVTFTPGNSNNLVLGMFYEGGGSGYFTGETVYYDGVQVEQKAIATPYVETSNGSTASRSDAAASAPASLINNIQSWMSVRARIDAPTGSGQPTHSFFSWNVNSNTTLHLYYNSSSGTQLRAGRQVTGSENTVAINYSGNVGDLVTVTFAWTATNLYLSLNGGAFVSVSNTATSGTGYPSTFNIGSAESGTGVGALDGDILWFATGTGILTNTDASNIYGFGNADPGFSSFPGYSTPTMVWQANNSSYINNSNNSSITFNVQNSSGNSLLDVDSNLMSVNLQAATNSTAALVLGNDANLYRSAANTLKTDSSLVVAGANAKFQNTTDSTNAFQIQNAAGTSNLLVADTADSRIGIGTASATSTLTVSGSGLIQQSAATNSLTVSGNEITDASRTTNTQGDGRTPPDSSYGIWESTTNLVTNGGMENNFTTWAGETGGETISRDTAKAEFGTASLKVITPGLVNNEGAYQSDASSNGTGGQTYTFSAWVWAASGATLQLRAVTAGLGAIGTTSFTGNNAWQRVTFTGALSGTGAQTASVQIWTNGIQATTFWVDGVQIEQKAYATPYVETSNGSTASRSAAGVTGPSNVITSAQGWMAIRLRPGISFSGWPPIISIDSGTTTNELDVAGAGDATQAMLEIHNGGSADVVNSNVGDVNLASGNLNTVIVAWTSSQMKISGNGNVFRVVNRTVGNPDLTGTVLRIGKFGWDPGQIDSDVLWFAAGTGTLTNTDASNIYNFGNTDPNLASFPVLGAPTMVWQANTANYINSANQGLVFSVQNSTGSGLLNVDANISKLSANASASFQNITNSTTAFQVQNATGGTVLGVDTTNGLVNLGTPGSSGANGQIVFNSTNAGGYGVTIAATSALSQSYTLNLPTAVPTQGQCLQIDSVDATQLTFGSCGTGGGGGGGGTLQDAYNNSSSPAAIITTSPSKTIVLKAGTSNDSTTLFQVQNSAGTDVLNVDTTNNRVGIGTNAPGAKLDIQTANNIGLNVNQTGSNNLLQLQNTGTNVLSVSDTGAVLAQNSTNSTSAFQIQNQAGTSNLFVADTTDTRIGIGTNTPTATLAVNGTGLIQASSTSNPTLTVSGNEITDATRTTNTQGDGRTPPDSSYGIWEATTNLVTNGGLETNATGWSGGVGRSTAVAKFGSAAYKATLSYSGDYTTWGNTSVLTQGSTYTVSAWVYQASGSSKTGSVALCSTDQASCPIQSSNASVTSGTWTRITAMGTIPTGDGKTYGAFRFSPGSGTSIDWYIDGVQVEQKAIATPYVETSNGSTASRNAAQVQAPSSLLSGAKGWVATRIRLPYASNAVPNGYAELFHVNTGLGDQIELYIQNGVVRTDSQAGGGTTYEVSQATSFAAGSTITVIGAWDSGNVYVSVNGANFTSTARTGTPTLASNFNIGSGDINHQLDGDVLWFSAGTGTLTNTDASNIYAFGNTDPGFSSFPGYSTPTMVWQANNSSYINGSTSSPLVFNVQNSSGSSLLSVDSSLSAVNLQAATTATSALIFGNDTSANLYRSAAATLQTSGSLVVGNNISAGGSGTITGNFTNNGLALFQNSTDSTTAFQIQNSAGTSNLLVADTTDSRIGIGTATPTATLSVNGSGLIQQSAATGTTLATSGNEITDAIRTTNTQGDGRTPPDSSYGIWEGTTNLVTNGNVENNLTGWDGSGTTGGITRDSTRAKFGSWSVKAIYGVAGEAVVVPQSTTFTSGITYTFSAWIYSPSGTGSNVNLFIGGSAFPATYSSNMTTRDAWTKVTVSATATSTASGSLLVKSQATGGTVWIDGAQMEQKAIATPYVDTNGGTASRSAARVQAPSSNLNATQGWVAIRARMGWVSTTPPTSNTRIFSWTDGTNNNRYIIYWNDSLNQWYVTRTAGGASASEAVSDTFNAGDFKTLIFSWTASQIGLSLNGSGFVSTPASGTVSGLSSLFDIGGNGTTPIDSDVLWFASGTGTLTNTDASNIYNFGNTDPNLTSFAGAANPTMAWAANTATYINSNSQPIVFQVQNSAATNLLSIDANATQLAANTTAIFQNPADSISAFQIQNAAGTSNLFKADTLDTRIGIAAAAPAYTLDVGGDINTSGTYRINGVQISTASLSDAANIALLNANNSFSGNNTFTGTVLAENTANSTTAFQVQGSTGNILLVADTTNMRIYVGNPAGDTTGELLVLSNKTTAGDPAGTNGAMYYNASLGKFRCYENGAWENCVYGAQTTVKTADQAFSGTSYSNVNDMGFAVGASKSYLLQCSLLVSVSGNGGNISMNGPASPNNYTATFMKTSDQSAGDQFVTSNTYDDPNSSTPFQIVTSTNGSNRFELGYTAILANGVNAGTWQLRAKAISGGTITLYSLSTCDLRPF